MLTLTGCGGARAETTNLSAFKIACILECLQQPCVVSSEEHLSTSNCRAHGICRLRACTQTEVHSDLKSFFVVEGQRTSERMSRSERPESRHAATVSAHQQVLREVSLDLGNSQGDSERGQGPLEAGGAAGKAEGREKLGRNRSGGMAGSGI